MSRNLLIAASVVAFWCLAATPVSAQSNLFSQYSTGGMGTTTAGMYPAPHYSPSLGAQTYYTYQPLMPHEMMYQHSRNYYNYYNTNGHQGSPNALNKTTVRWQSGTNHFAPLPYTAGLSGLTYKLQARKYCIGGNCGGGGATRGAVRGGGRLRGGLGCASGNCDTGETAYTEDVYGGGEVLGGESCSGGCTANLSDGSLNR